MPVFRFYIFEKSGLVSGPPTFYELPDDDTALKAADKILNDRAIEIWRGASNNGRGHKVGRLEPQKPSKSLGYRD